MNRALALMERREGLIERVKLAERHKQDAIDKVQKLAARFSIGEISHDDYHNLLTKTFGQRTPQEWVDYYDNYISSCEKLLGD